MEGEFDCPSIYITPHLYYLYNALVDSEDGADNPDTNNKEQQ